MITSLVVSDHNLCFARWTTPEDAILEVERTSRNLYIKKNGSAIDTYEVQLKILKDSAKELYKNYSYIYDKSNQTVKVLEANIIHNKKKYNIITDKITDTPISSEKHYLMAKHQVVIPYPILNINDRVYLKTKSHTFNGIPNHYITHFTFGENYTLCAKTSITSELPLHININDPEKVLNITKSIKYSGKKKLYYLQIQQNRPFYKAIVDEKDTYLNPKHLPIVSLCASEKLTTYGSTLAKAYAKIKNEPLPILYKEILQLAQIHSHPIQKINAVTSLLKEKINYLSDISTNQKGFIPQHLETVAKTRLGDCKDFSMATCVILNAMGIKAQLGLISHKNDYLDLPSDLPGQQIDHAIVKVELPERTLWIDPTHYLSMGAYIMPHLSNKKALVLADNEAKHEVIPNIKPSDSQTIIKEIWELNNSNIAKISG